MNVWTSREAFGERLKDLRATAGLTLRELDALAGVAYSNICSIEHGERATGSITAYKLADALALQGTYREEFLLQAAGTRRKDKLVLEARELPAELLNFVPQALIKAGVNVGTISACHLNKQEASTSDLPSKRLTQSLGIELKSGNKINCLLTVTHS
jgi:transcriptional regulator with XRE-family HTH domain